MDTLTRYAAIRFPFAGADTTQQRSSVQRLSAATTSWLIPQEWRGKIVFLRVVGTDVQVGDSVGAQTLVWDQLSSANGTLSAAAGATVLNGEVIEGQLADSATHINWVVKPAGVGTIELWVSEVKPWSAVG